MSGRRCPSCGEALVIEEELHPFGVRIRTSLKCEACASTVLLLGPAALGALLGCALSCFVVCGWFALGKDAEPAGSLAALALGLFFAFLAGLRVQDDRRSRPVRAGGRSGS